MAHKPKPLYKHIQYRVRARQWEVCMSKVYLGQAFSQKAAAKIAAQYLKVSLRSLLRKCSTAALKRKYKYVFFCRRTHRWEVVTNRKFRGSAASEVAAAAIAAKCLKLDISDLLLDSQPRSVRCQSDAKGIQESSFCNAEESPELPKPEWRHTHYHQGRLVPSC
jgi:hypothetical protein